MFSPDKFKLNQNYGNGIFRRRIRLAHNIDSPDSGCVHGALEDCNHGFQSTIFYRNGVVTEISPQFMRIPFTTCGGAEQPLKKLVGAAITSTPNQLLAIAPPLSNCTHLYDLTLLAIAHTQKNEKIVQYDVEVTDAVNGISDLRVWRTTDNTEPKLIHHWQSFNLAIKSPENIKGNPLFFGFSRWANALFEGIENEAAFILQKGNLVSFGRQIDVEAMTGSRAIDENDRVACHTYSPENSSNAFRIGGTVRDFTDTPEQLLKFK